MLLAALLAAVGSITGAVTWGGALPGVTVTIRSGTTAITQITDVHGAYAFDNVPLGSYDVTFELSGLKTERRSISVHAGANAIPVVDLTPKGNVCSTTIVVCGKPPSTPWDLPSCDDLELDNALIKNAKLNDRSAIGLLERRYATEITFCERFRIGGALLGRIQDDRAIWSELSAHAERLVAAAGDDEKLETYGATNGYERYGQVAWDAFFDIAEDRRARPLLLRALASDDSELSIGGLYGLALQSDAPPLSELEAALQKHPDFVFDLVEFHSEAVDALALKILSNDADRAEYRRRAIDSASPSP